MTRWGRLSGLIAVLLLLAVSNSAAFAQAKDTFGAALKLADAGKHRDAVSALSGVLNSGTLSPVDTARGFYLRGVSYVKTGKNPQAISDLTNALWLTGLSDNERANGYRMRAAAYKASGFKAKAVADLKRADRSPTSVAAGLATTAPAAGAIATTGNSWAAQTAAATQTAKVDIPKSAPTTPASSGNAISNFFSGIFGGGNSTTPSTSKKATAATAKATEPAATAWSAQTAAGETAVSSWSSEVAAVSKRTVAKKPVKVKPKQVAAINWGAASVATAPKKTVRKTQPVKKPVVKKKAARKGRFNVQVATVRERATAETIRRSIAAKASGVLAGLTPTIDKAVLGNMGTFYRVRVDGLPSRQASLRLCQTLAKSGHDCFLITR